LIQTVICSRFTDLDQAMAWLRETLSSNRFDHSLGVYEKALALAEGFGLSVEDCERAATAGLLHDAAKLMNSRELLDACTRHDITLDEVDRATPQTLHPVVGAELVRERFGIEDVVTLDAIRYHTTGRAAMTLVEKIVYVADKVEDRTREPGYIQAMTAALDYSQPWSLDLTVLTIINGTLEFLMQKNQLIHPRTIDARNDIVNRLRADAHL
jgi:predicted HD superfamily hydrolase involved in NAD metabolism